MNKRFLNLNPFAGKPLAAIALLLIVIPGLGWLLASAGVRSSALAWVTRASLWAGAALLLVFVLLLILEQILDARLFRAYRKTLTRRIPLPDGLAECPYCGFRSVRAFDRACPACGKELT